MRNCNIGWLTSRVHITSRWPLIQSERMDPWKHEDRSSVGGSSHSPPRPPRDRDQNQILIWRWISFMGCDRKWIEQIRDGNVGRNTRKPQRWICRQCRETCCESKDRNKHQCRCHLFRESRYHFTRENGLTSNREVRPKLFWSFEEDDQIASSVLREEDGAVEFKIFAPMFASKFASSPHWSIRTWLSHLQRGGGPKKRFQYCLDPSSAETVLYLRAVQGHTGGKQMNPTCRTTCCYRATLPSTSTTLEAPTTCTLSSNQDWFRVEVKFTKGDRRYSSQPWILCPYIYTSRGITTWRTQNCSVQTKLENTPEHNVLGQFECCSEEGIDVLSNKI